MNHSKHEIDWASGLCVAFIISVCVVTFLGLLFLPSSGLVKESGMKVEVISTTSEPLVTEVVTDNLATDEVVGKLVASATNKETADITFSVRLRLANGETNKNK